MRASDICPEEDISREREVRMSGCGVGDSRTANEHHQNIPAIGFEIANYNKAAKSWDVI
jgi:hypothetical protein